MRFACFSSLHQCEGDWIETLFKYLRRSGKPTSLGCFDHEEQAARAYDKMMLWCELHNSSGVKGGITNFDPAEYEKDLSWLQVVNQVVITYKEPQGIPNSRFISYNLCVQADLLSFPASAKGAQKCPSMSVLDTSLHLDAIGCSLKEAVSVSQDELVTALRGDGRKQAAQRMLRQKKDGQLVSYDSSGFETASG